MIHFDIAKSIEKPTKQPRLLSKMREGFFIAYMVSKNAQTP